MKSTLPPLFKRLAGTNNPALNSIEKLNNQFKRASLANKRRMLALDVLKQLKLRRIIADHGVFTRTRLHTNMRDIPKFNTLADDAGLIDMQLYDPCVQAVVNEQTKAQVRCECCADGALFIAACNLDFGTAKRSFEEPLQGTSKAYGRESVIGAPSIGPLNSGNVLHKYFSYKELQLIEFLFEGGSGAVQSSELWKVMNMPITVSRRYMFSDNFAYDMADVPENAAVMKRVTDYLKRLPYNASKRLMILMRNIASNGGRLRIPRLEAKYHPKPPAGFS